MLGACTTVIHTNLDGNNIVEITQEKPTPSAAPWLNESWFGNPIPLIQTDALIQLSGAQQNEFLSYYHDPKNLEIKPSIRISDYLDKYLVNFNYYSDTLTAQDSLIQFQGNCLTLAILTKAYANLAQIEIDYQLVETTPVFQQKGDLVISSQHVRTRLRDPVDSIANRIVIFPSHVTIDYFPSRGTRVLRTIDEAEFYSMYYRNKAAEALIGENEDLAYWLLRQSLSLKPTDSSAINMMAVVFYRKGLFTDSEKIYLHGINTAAENLDLLSNYHAFLLQQQRFFEAEEIAYKVDRYNNSNPFKWISLANQAYNEKDYSKAIRFYRRAMKLAPYLHETHAGIARAKIQLGDFDSARKEIQVAMENSYEEDTTSVYQEKYRLLTELVNK